MLSLMVFYAPARGGSAQREAASAFVFCPPPHRWDSREVSLRGRLFLLRVPTDGLHSRSGR